MTETVDPRTIEVWEYLPEYEAERDELLATVDRVFRSGRLVLGESLAGVEREFAAYCGVAHGVGVDNGTNAIVLGLRALGVQAEDEVITTSNAAPGTVVAIPAAGGAGGVRRHRSRDLPDGRRQAEVRDHPGHRPASVPAHLFGQCVDMDRVQRDRRRPRHPDPGRLRTRPPAPRSGIAGRDPWAMPPPSRSTRPRCWAPMATAGWW